MAKTILVTGSSTGIGYHIACTLAERGCRVFAGARKKSDLERLGKIENIVPVKLDVTEKSEIASVVKHIASEGQRLDGLVNNAGLGGLGPFTTWSETEFHQIFDVNAYGPWRLSNACLDLLLASKGRIVNIGSQGGMITTKYFGPYTMTKYALEAYTEAFRAELEAKGVHVSIVQPGGIVSDIGANSMPSTSERFHRAKPPFHKEAQEALKSFESPSDADEDSPESATNRKPSHPSIVTDAVCHALFHREPRPRYLVGTQWEGNRVIKALFEKLVHSNASPTLGYTRDELISMLDDALAESPNKDWRGA
ncbi:MAG: SDR family oxidoreductase [Candidatus Eisenbacteria bacterium]|uniref:SDR family oxidoreductase n=1 Tax=Eiseniibacteriota bacterium TaxID=2212470 RepID=A0A7Y2EAG4_UNCEI|nr:SDR family oxidoreductase [Candidatus Eisenbacteria bacterium]